MTCNELCAIGQNSITLKSMDRFGYSGFQTKFQTHPPKLAEVEPHFRKVSLPPAKLCMLFPTGEGWGKEGVGGRGRRHMVHICTCTLHPYGNLPHLHA